MLRCIARAAVLAGVVLGSSLAFALSTGPPLSRTGAPAIGGKPAEQACTLCHNMSFVNDGTGSVEILDLPFGYTPGQAYPLRVRVSSTANAGYENRKWGFQLTAVYQANGLGAGTWVIPNSPPDSLRRNTYSTASSSTYKTRVYISHTSPATRTGQASPVEWQFQWVAPPVDSGTVIFCVAGNAANGDSASLGTDDHIYTSRDTVLAPSLVVSVPPGAPERYQTALEPPFPNPMTLCVAIDFALARAGNLDLVVYDPQGRKVRTLYRGWHEAGPGFSFWDGRADDGAWCANGVYFVRLQAAGERLVHTQRLVIAR